MAGARELLRRMNSFHGAGSSKALCLPFVVAGQQVGHVPPSVVKSLHRYPAVFSMSQSNGEPTCVELNKKLASYEQRTEAVQGILREMRAQQDFPCLKEWREEAAGGIASGLGVRETLVKESLEEACIPASLTALAKAAGTISYTYESPQGGIYAECQFVFDLKLPEGFVPQVGDGEVQQFYLWPLEKVKEAIGSSDFKPNCAMVALDFLIRHGYIQPDGEPHYTELVEGLHQTL